MPAASGGNPAPHSTHGAPASSSTPARHPATIVVGLLCVLGGVLILGVRSDRWQAFFGYGPSAAARPFAESPEASTSDAGTVIAPRADPQSWFQRLHRATIQEFGDVLLSERSQMLTGIGVFLLGGAVLGAAFFPFLVTTALLALSLWESVLLTQVPLSAGWLALVTVALGFCFHAPARTGPLPMRGVIGVLCVAAGGLLIYTGGVPWSRLAGMIGRGTDEFFRTWGDLCTWGVVLTLTGVGVGVARSRRASFMNAVMLTALAVFCVRTAMVVAPTFTDLPAAASRPVESVSLSNVPLWRWLIAGDLVLLVGVLLYQSRGFGLLTIAFAAAWMLVAVEAHRSIGTLSAMRAISDHMVVQMGPNPLANWGLPIGPGGDASTPPARHPQRVSGAAPAPQWSRASGMSDEEIERGKESLRQAINRAQRQAEFREATAGVWIIASAVLAGLIAAGGLAQYSSHPLYRALMPQAIWVGCAAAVAWLVMRAPPDSGESVLSQALEWLQSRQRGLFLWTVFGATLALAAPFALRRGADARNWSALAVGAVFLGTVLSLGAIAILIRFGGFSALPTWVYITVAAGQSSLAWLLMLRAQLGDDGFVDSPPVPEEVPAIPDAARRGADRADRPERAPRPVAAAG